MHLTKKIEDRIFAAIKQFQPILGSAKARDVNESDTVTIVIDMLSDLFGYDKYSEITSEHGIRGTYVDLAICTDGKVQFLIEVKAIGLELKDAHVKQAVDYAANKGIDWVLLTNGILWRIYKLSFEKPIDQELVAEFDFLALDSKRSEDAELIYLLTKEGWEKKVLEDFNEQKQALSKFCMAAMILSEPVLDVIRRELRRAFPDVRLRNEQIRAVLTKEVLKREIVEGDEAEEAQRKLARTARRSLRAKKEESVQGVNENALVVQQPCSGTPFPSVATHSPIASPEPSAGTSPERPQA